MTAEMGRDAMIAHLILLGWEPRQIPSCVNAQSVYSPTLDVLMQVTMACGKVYCPLTSRPHFRGQECSWDGIRTHELVEVVARADELKLLSDYV